MSEPLASEPPAGAEDALRVRETAFTVSLGYAPAFPLAIALAGAAVALAIASGRAAPLLLAVGPLWAIASAARARLTDPRLIVRTWFDASRLLEGGRGRLAVEIEAGSLETPLLAALIADVPKGLALSIPAGAIRAAPAAARRIHFILAERRPARFEFEVQTTRRGLFRIGGLRLILVPPGRLVRAGLDVAPAHVLEVLPRTAPIADIPTPARLTGVLPGLHRSRRPGSGLEFAGLRDYAEGDPVTALDWRASARWLKWVVRQRFASRNAEVVILLDVLSYQADACDNTLEACVRAAAGVAQTLLREGSRVGLVTYGGTLTWVRPNAGRRQRWLLMRRLRDIEATPTYARKNLSNLPSRVLPPHATVIGISSLADSRFVDVLGSLKARGWAVSLVYLPAQSVVRPGGAAARLALRLKEIENRALLDELRGAGVPVKLVGGNLSGSRSGARRPDSSTPAPLERRLFRERFLRRLPGAAASALAAVIALGAGVLYGRSPLALGSACGALALSALILLLLGLATVADGPGLPLGSRSLLMAMARAGGLPGAVLLMYLAGLVVAVTGGLLSGLAGNPLAVIAGLVGLGAGLFLVLRSATAG